MIVEPPPTSILLLLTVAQGGREEEKGSSFFFFFRRITQEKTTCRRCFPVISTPSPEAVIQKDKSTTSSPFLFFFLSECRLSSPFCSALAQGRERGGSSSDSLFPARPWIRLPARRSRVSPGGLFPFSTARPSLASSVWPPARRSTGFPSFSRPRCHLIDDGVIPSLPS